MLDIRSSAPGKVIVAGEYAVLDGAPAICMAVDRRAHVSITPAEGEYHTVLAPGYAAAVGRFSARAGRIEWQDGAAQFPLLAAVWQELAARPVHQLAIVLDSNEFHDVTSGGKYGIGSSAALVVALTAALDMVHGGGRDVARIAGAAHRQLQNGAGSGADIACCFAGGVIEYRMGVVAPRALPWPAGLHYALLWSGVSASTAAQLAKLSHAASGASRADLLVASGAVATAWQGGDAGAIISALRDYVTVLQRFDAEHALGIYAAGHATLAKSADSCGVVYKPCGAGGGDLGIVIASAAADVAAFVSRAHGQGFRHMAMALEPGGLRCDGDLR